MPKRGDVVRLQHRLGFGPKGIAESVVIVQATALLGVLPMVLVVPLEPDIDVHAVTDPRWVLVPASEAGGRAQLAMVSQLRPVPFDALAHTVHGSLSRGTMKAIERALRLILAL